MTIDASAEVRAFFEAVTDSRELWDAFEVRLVAAKIEAEWVCLSGVCMLHLRQGERSKRRRGKQQNSRILAVEATFPLARLEAFLNSLTEGSVVVGGELIRVTNFIRLRHERNDAESVSGAVLDSALNWNFSRATQVSTQLSPPPLVNAHLLSMQGSTSATNALSFVEGGMQAVNDELRSPRYNVNGLRHLLNRIGASLHDWSPDYGLSFTVLAPLGIGLNLERTEFRSGTLRLAVVASSTTAAKLGSIGISGESPDHQQVSTSIRLRDQPWHEDGAVLLAETHVELPRLAKLHLLLRVKTASIQSVEIHHTNVEVPLLQAAHACHHPSSDEHWRKHLIESKGSDANEFAAAVARLTTGLGLPTVHFAREKNSDSSDSVARLGRNHLLLIESTTSTFDDKKLGNLVRRAGELRRCLRARGVEISDDFIRHRSQRLGYLGRALAPERVCIVPLMVVSVPATDVLKAALKNARLSNVVVFTREDLQLLLRMCDIESDHEELVADLISGRIQQGPV